MLRVIAASGLVAFHLQIYTHNEGDTFHLQLPGFGLFVDIFFVISGVVISHVYLEGVGRQGTYALFMRKRLARLVPLHLLTASIYWLLTSISVTDPPHTTVCHALTFALMQAWGLCPHLILNGPSWSISAEMAMYALFPIFAAVALRRRHLVLVMAVAAFILLSWSTYRLELRPWPNWTYDFGGVRAVPAFLLGIWLTRARCLLMRVPMPSAGLFISLSLFMAAVVLEAPALGHILIAYAVVIFAVAADTQHRAGPLVRFLAPYGRLTYTVYMIHSPLLLAASMAGRGFMGLEDAGMWTLVVLTVLVILPPLAYATHIGFEQPLRNRFLK